MRGRVGTSFDPLNMGLGWEIATSKLGWESISLHPPLNFKGMYLSVFRCWVREVAGFAPTRSRVNKVVADPRVNGGVDVRFGAVWWVRCGKMMR